MIIIDSISVLILSEISEILLILIITMLKVSLRSSPLLQVNMK